MRIRIVREIFLKELREALRDRRSVMALFGVPLFLYPLMFFGFGSMAVSAGSKMVHTTYAVVLTNSAGAPHLRDILDSANSGVVVVNESDPMRALRDGKVSAVIAATPDFEANVVAGKMLPISIEVDRSKSTTALVEGKIGTALTQYEHWVIARRLGLHGISTTLATPIVRRTDDIESNSARLAMTLAQVLPMLLLLTGLTASLSTALVATTSEREAGSMESLLVTPVRKAELLFGKALLVYLAGVFAMVCNLGSMSLVLWRVSRSAPHGSHALLDPHALVVTVLAVLPTLLFIAALCLVIGLAARNYREASSYAQFPILCIILPVMANMSDPKVTPGMLATPVLNTSIVVRQVLLGKFIASDFWMAVAFSLFWAVVMLALAARLFDSEQLVNVDWEPLTMMRRGRRNRRPRLPTIDEGLLSVGLSLLLTFYVVPEWLDRGLLQLTALTEVLLTAGPALLMARVLGYRWVETFSLRVPSSGQVVGGLLLGLGAVPVVGGLEWLQNRLWAPNPANAAAIRDMFGPSLLHAPFVTAIVLGGLAGVCEELLFRGPLLQSMRRRMPLWGALLASGAIFAAMHMDLHGMILRTLLGMLLGWIVVRTGSIVPAMLAHAVYDASAVLVSAYDAHRYGLAYAFSETTHVPYLPVAFVIGLLLMWFGRHLIVRQPSATVSDADLPAAGFVN